MSTASDADAPLVSVVIAAFNAERFLAEAISSVLNQTHRELEVIVVDDGSTDSTASVVERSLDPRVRLLRQPNKGVSMARNAGIEAARGEYVAFLDADDVWLPSKVERQLSVFRQHPAMGLVCGGYQIVDESLQELLTVTPRPRHLRSLRMLYLEGDGVGLSFTGVVPVRILREVGGFDELLSTGADVDLACRIARSHPITAVRETVALYRTHFDQMHLDRQAFEADYLRILDKSLPSGGVRSTLRRRRAVANMYTRLVLYEATHRDYGRAWRALGGAMASRPDRLVVLPLTTLPVRAARLLAARRRRSRSETVRARLS
jgi:glycosyltransferase involved in cell wall biosynthesis